MLIFFFMGYRTYIKFGDKKCKRREVWRTYPIVRNSLETTSNSYFSFFSFLIFFDDSLQLKKNPVLTRISIDILAWSGFILYLSYTGTGTYLVSDTVICEYGELKQHGPRLLETQTNHDMLLGPKKKRKNEILNWIRIFIQIKCKTYPRRGIFQ